MDGIHLNADSLRALVRATGAQRQRVALEAGVSASALTNYLSGYRTRASDEVRGALASAISTFFGFEVHPRAITCHCTDPTVHQEEPTDG